MVERRRWTIRRALAALVAGAMLMAGLVGVVPTSAEPAPDVRVPELVLPGVWFLVTFSATCDAPELTVSVPELDYSSTFAPTLDSAGRYESPPLFLPNDAQPGHYLMLTGPERCGYPTATLTVGSPPTGSIRLLKTVGTEPGVCADTSDIAVPVGTTVYYCYTMVNDTNYPLTPHAISDDVLGSDILSDTCRLSMARMRWVCIDDEIPPGGRLSTVDLGRVISTVVTGPVVNTARWETWQQSPIEPVAGMFMETTATATVAVATEMVIGGGRMITPPAARTASVSPAYTG